MSERRKGQSKSFGGRRSLDRFVRGQFTEGPTEQQATILQTAEKMREEGFFRPRSIGETTRMLPTIDLALSNYQQTIEQLRGQREVTVEDIETEVSRYMRLSVPEDKRQRLSAAAFERYDSSAIRGAVDGFSVGHDEEPSNRLKKKARKTASTIANALTYEEAQRENPNDSPNLYVARLKLNATGVFVIDVLEDGTITADIPTIVDGRSYLLCYRPEDQNLSLHDWEEETHQETISLSRPLTQTRNAPRGAETSPEPPFESGRTWILNASSQDIQGNTPRRTSVPFDMEKLEPSLRRRLKAYLQARRRGNLELFTDYMSFEKKFGYVIDAYDSATNDRDNQ